MKLIKRIKALFKKDPPSRNLFDGTAFIPDRLDVKKLQRKARKNI